MNGYIPTHLVDSKVMGYTQWQKEMREEDIRECGGPVPRSHEQACRLYRAYVKFQSMADAVAARRERG